ncbi:MAG: 50S ribosomal protein L28 [Chloroflexi bacterium]|nr:50S ribosomal protein L28 [Chloroflexota bacterium]
MASTCEVCGKTVHIGRTIRFQNTGKWFRRATKKSRAFKPNVQRATLVVQGMPMRLNVCTRCLRTAHRVD